MIEEYKTQIITCDICKNREEKKFGVQQKLDTPITLKICEDTEGNYPKHHRLEWCICRECAKKVIAVMEMFQTQKPKG